jgi:hypothetical protein
MVFQKQFSGKHPPPQGGFFSLKNHFLKIPAQRGFRKSFSKGFIKAFSSFF